MEYMSQLQRDLSIVDRAVSMSQMSRIDHSEAIQAMQRLTAAINELATLKQQQKEAEKPKE